MLILIFYLQSANRTSAQASAVRLIARINQNGPNNLQLLHLKDPCHHDWDLKGVLLSNDATTPDNISDHPLPDRTSVIESNLETLDDIYDAEASSSSSDDQPEDQDPSQASPARHSVRVKERNHTRIPPWRDPHSFEWDLKRVLQSDDAIAPDNLLDLPPPSFIYVDESKLDTLEDFYPKPSPPQLKRNVLDVLEAPHPKLAILIEAGTDMPVDHFYFEDMLHNLCLPLAGLPRSKGFGGSEVRTVQASATTGHLSRALSANITSRLSISWPRPQTCPPS